MEPILDGHAHERLSYQNLREPKTDLLVLANSAFVKYKNKYHAGFGVHGVLLEAAFPSYAFKMVCSRDQYVALFKDWANWLL
ncbi:MAG: hypothetical protein KatS3mg025_1800 [Bacteroidia bacterium]|jgi:hypothetical protein|nr:MAG: hypothetical protein KatS3mg025_1800 [Bacteroidia bacterium]